MRQQGSGMQWSSMVANDINLLVLGAMNSVSDIELPR